MGFISNLFIFPTSSILGCMSDVAEPKKYPLEYMKRMSDLKKDEEVAKSGYHITHIPKGIIGQFSKIEEELAEAADAREQGCRIMELVELSDLYGALELYVQKSFGMTMNDLKNMSDITQRAFRNGRR